MNTYKQGLKDEALVIARLKSSFKEVHKSSKHEDMQLDIDVWVDTIPVSIKAQHICLRTGNLGFELEVQDRHTNMFAKSWYYQGQARLYAVLVGTDLYYVCKQSLQTFVKSKGWDQIKSLSPKVLQEQSDMNHRHKDTRMGLIKLDTLLKSGIARKAS